MLATLEYILSSPSHSSAICVAKSEQMADLKEWQKAEGAGDFFRCPKEIPVPSLKPVFVTLIDRNNFLEKNRADWQIARVTPTLNRIISQP